MKIRVNIDRREEVTVSYGDVQIVIEAENREVATDVASTLVRDMMYQMGKIGK